MCRRIFGFICFFYKFLQILQFNFKLLFDAVGFPYSIVHDLHNCFQILPNSSNCTG